MAIMTALLFMCTSAMPSWTACASQEVIFHNFLLVKICHSHHGSTVALACAPQPRQAGWHVRCSESPFLNLHFLAVMLLAQYRPGSTIALARAPEPCLSHPGV
eukprot:scaffold221969_cov17-Tisochrysis_lutea.AAC.2